MSWVRLPHLAAFSIEGPDALAFAQSQLTCNVDQCPPEHWHPTAWCNAKGQTQAILLIRCRPTKVDCILPQSQAEPILKGLGMFTIGRRVELSTIQSVIGRWQIDDTHQLSFDPTRALELDPDQTPDASVECTDQWRHQDIERGLAWLNPDLAGRFLPQSLGLEAIGGLSYKKGCYPGQEVIAKVHFRGQIKQHLVRLLASQPAAELSSGTALFEALSDTEQLPSEPSTPIGEVVSWLSDKGLAVVKVRLPNGTPIAVSAGGPPICMLEYLDADSAPLV